MMIHSLWHICFMNYKTLWTFSGLWWEWMAFLAWQKLQSWRSLWLTLPMLRFGENWIYRVWITAPQRRCPILHCFQWEGQKKARIKEGQQHRIKAWENLCGGNWGGTFWEPSKGSVWQCKVFEIGTIYSHQLGHEQEDQISCCLGRSPPYAHFCSPNFVWCYNESKLLKCHCDKSITS